MARSRGTIWLLLLMLSGCSCDSDSKPARPGASASAPVEQGTPPQPLASGIRPLVPRGSASVAQREQLAPLAGPKQLSLELAGKPVGRTLVPVGEKLTQPVLVVLTTPDTAKECERWEQVKPSSGFLLCPSPASDSAAGVKNFKDSIQALSAKFGKHVGQRSTLVGYGAGADTALDLLRESPILFPRGFLIGGGVSGFSSGVVQAFAAQGGERVLFACQDCAAGRSVSNLLRSGIQAKHLDQAELDAEALKSAWAWLSEGDPWW
ncbi:MAG: hypothetical protein H6718_28175 [Polyangiaceae bacterium]|nr:hypothetical protein [Myxococcales bacterium]MCB9589325.1 hypothetical protein [Polyangiaceae bacterium]